MKKESVRRSIPQYSFPKLEFDETLLEKHYTPLKARRIDYVVVHHMTIPGLDSSTSALDACYRTWQDRKASAHYGVQGLSIRQFVYDKDFAWATGSSVGNLRGISIEHANSTVGPKWLVSNMTIHTGAKLAAWIHIVYGLGRPKSDSIGHSGTLRQHDAFTSTGCPGPYLGGTEWNAYVKETQKQYDLAKGIAPTPATPAVPVPPIPSPVLAGPTMTKRTSYANCAAFDTVGRGKATRVQRADEAARLLLSGDPHFIHAVEVSEDMFPKMDRIFADYTRIPQGGEGRESWYKNGQGTRILVVKRHDISRKNLHGGDDKQYLVYVWEENGFRGIEVVFHLENEGQVQKAQLQEVLSTAADYKEEYDIQWANLCVTGDTNSPSAEAWVDSWGGWRTGDSLAPAASRANEEYQSFNGWSSKTRLGAKIDLFIVWGSTRVTRFNQTVGKKSSAVFDHNKQFLVREILK